MLSFFSQDLVKEINLFCILRNIYNFNFNIFSCMHICSKMNRITLISFSNQFEKYNDRILLVTTSRCYIEQIVVHKLCVQVKW